MNWFTRSAIIGTTEAKKKMIEEDGGCDHVVADPDLAVSVSREKDSFGTVGQYVCCAECLNKQAEAENEVKYCCTDCKSMVAKKDGLHWRWYDFYAPQGDEPIFVCNPCRVLPKHQNRVRQDREDYEAEFPQNDGY